MRREEPCLPVRRYFRGGRTWLGTRRKGEKCQVRQAEGSLNSAYCISFRGALLALGVLPAWRLPDDQQPRAEVDANRREMLRISTIVPPPRGLDRLQKQV